MCLSNIYKQKGEEKELIFKNAANIVIEKDKLVVYDIMGRTNEIEGHIESVDLLENIILIKN